MWGRMRFTSSRRRKSAWTKRTGVHPDTLISGGAQRPGVRPVFWSGRVYEREGLAGPVHHSRHRKGDQVMPHARRDTDIHVAFAQTREDVNAMKSAISYIKEDLAQLAASIDKLASRIEDRSKPNWPLLSVCVGLVPFVMGGMIWLMSAQIGSAIAPLDRTTTLNNKSIDDLAITQRRLLEMATGSQQADVNS